MIIYISIFCVLSFFSFLEIFTTTRNSIFRLLGVCITLVFMLLSSIRSGVIGDYVTYKEVFDRMCDTSSLTAFGNFFYEPLYSTLQWISKNIYSDFQFFVMVLAILVMSIQYAVVRYSGNNVTINDRANNYYVLTKYMMLWALFIGNIFVIRSTIAVVICWYSIRYIEAKKIKKFLLCMLLAIGFHYGAMVFLVAYPIYHYHSSLKRKYTILIGLVVVAYLGMGILPTLLQILPSNTITLKIQGYLAGGTFAGTGYLAIGMFLLLKAIVNIGVLLVVFSYLWGQFKNDRVYEGYLNIYFFGCVLYLSTMFQSYAFARISLFFNVFQIELMVYLFKKITKDKILYWIFLTAYLFIRLIINTSSGGYIPFETIFGTL